MYDYFTCVDLVAYGTWMARSPTTKDINIACVRTLFGRTSLLLLNARRMSHSSLRFDALSVAALTRKEALKGIVMVRAQVRRRSHDNNIFVE
jgi:hypothetical protein